MGHHILSGIRDVGLSLQIGTPHHQATATVLPHGWLQRHVSLTLDTVLYRDCLISKARAFEKLCEDAWS
jgi:hypothetical protein